MLSGFTAAGQTCFNTLQFPGNNNGSRSKLGCEFTSRMFLSDNDICLFHKICA
jgi:hypothetical protein